MSPTPWVMPLIWAAPPLPATRDATHVHVICGTRPRTHSDMAMSEHNIQQHWLETHGDHLRGESARITASSADYTTSTLPPYCRTRGTELLSIFAHVYVRVAGSAQPTALAASHSIRARAGKLHAHLQADLVESVPSRGHEAASEQPLCRPPFLSLHPLPPLLLPPTTSSPAILVHRPRHDSGSVAVLPSCCASIPLCLLSQLRFCHLQGGHPFLT